MVSKHVRPTVQRGHTPDPPQSISDSSASCTPLEHDGGRSVCVGEWDGVPEGVMLGVGVVEASVHVTISPPFPLLSALLLLRGAPLMQTPVGNTSEKVGATLQTDPEYDDSRTVVELTQLRLNDVVGAYGLPAQDDDSVQLPLYKEAVQSPAVYNCSVPNPGNGGEEGDGDGVSCAAAYVASSTTAVHTRLNERAGMAGGGHNPETGAAEVGTRFCVQG